jgi:hypothetical protein
MVLLLVREELAEQTMKAPAQWRWQVEIPHLIVLLLMVVDWVVVMLPLHLLKMEVLAVVVLGSKQERVVLQLLDKVMTVLEEMAPKVVAFMVVLVVAQERLVRLVRVVQVVLVSQMIIKLVHLSPMLAAVEEAVVAEQVA